MPEDDFIPSATTPAPLNPAWLFLAGEIARWDAGVRELTIREWTVSIPPDLPGVTDGQLAPGGTVEIFGYQAPRTARWIVTQIKMR